MFPYYQTSAKKQDILSPKLLNKQKQCVVHYLYILGVFLTKLSITLSEISPAEDQDLGRLLLLYLWSSDLQRGPRCLLHYDGPGHGGSHLVSSQLLYSVVLIKLIVFKKSKSLESSWFIFISHIIIKTIVRRQVRSRENPD